MKDQSGFTMMESMIAIAIFAVGVLAVGSMQLAAKKTNTSAEMVTDAYTLASQEIEGRLGDPWNTTLPIVYTSDTGNVPYTIDTRVDWDTTEEITQRIGVVVSWRQRGDARRIQIRHLRSRASM